MTPVICLAKAIFFEARDQPITGQQMVAEVVMNRVEHEKYPDTVCKVVFQDKAFSFTHDGKSDAMSEYGTYFDMQAQSIATQISEEYVVYGDRLGSSATHYHTVSVAPYWKDDFDIDGVVGDHVFYTCTGYC